MDDYLIADRIRKAFILWVSETIDVEDNYNTIRIYKLNAANRSLTDAPKMVYNKGTKKAVHSSEWLPKFYVSIKIVTFALVGG